MIPDLRNLLNGNQFLSGGMLLGLLGGGVVLARQYLKQFQNWLWKQWTVEILVRNTDAPFDWLVLWLDQQPYTKRARRLVVSLSGENGDGPQAAGRGASSSGQEPKRPTVVFSPSVGNHFFLYRGRLLWLNRDREAASKDNWRERETFTITMFGRSQHLLRHLLDDAYDAYAVTVRQRSRVFVSVYDYWTTQGFVRPRSLESVILPGNQKEILLTDLKRFLADEDWYHDKGIPYRRGYLLHGVPGSGKTSLVAAVANVLGLHLYLVSLPGMGDRGLQDLLHNVSSPRAIMLFEDIDGAQASHVRTDEKSDRSTDDRVTLSGLLNALDGVASRDGCITMMTTNRRPILDAALTRPGRVDMELEFGWATPGQAVQMFGRFYGDTWAARVRHRFEQSLPAHTSMAELQEYFLRRRDDPESAAHLVDLHPRGLKVANDQ